MRLRRKSLGTALIVGLVGLLLVGPSGAAGDDGPVFGDSGRLDLILSGHPDAFEFTPTDQESPTGVEELSSHRCRLQESGDNLIDFFATGRSGSDGRPFVGLKYDRIGVRSGGERTGFNCATINEKKDETLSLALGSFFTIDQLASYAQVGLKAKAGTTVKVEAFLGEASVGMSRHTAGGYFYERLLLTVGDAESTDVVLDRVVISIVPSEDEEEDRGYSHGGNGWVSLIDTRHFDTFFNIVQGFEGEIECGEIVVIEGEAPQVEGAVIRVGEAGGDNPNCKGTKVFNTDAVLQEEGAEIAFLPEGEGENQVTYVARLEFGVQHALGDPLAVQYDPTGGTNFEPLPVCDTGDPLAADVSDALDTLGFDVLLLDGFDVKVPAGQSWCEVGRTTFAAGVGVVEDVLWAFGNDDPRFSGA